MKGLSAINATDDWDWLIEAIYHALKAKTPAGAPKKLKWLCTTMALYDQPFQRGGEKAPMAPPFATGYPK